MKSQSYIMVWLLQNPKAICWTGGLITRWNRGFDHVSDKAKSEAMVSSFMTSLYDTYITVPTHTGSCNLLIWRPVLKCWNCTYAACWMLLWTNWNLSSNKIIQLFRKLWITPECCRDTIYDITTWHTQVSPFRGFIAYIESIDQW